MFKFKPTSRMGSWNFMADNCLADGEEQLTGVYDETANLVTLNGDAKLTSDVSDDLQKSFIEFKTTSPVYVLGLAYDKFENPEGAKQLYIELLKGCIYAREDNTEKAERIFNRLMQWLTNTDFLVAPASSYFHDSYPTGLVEHSLRVAHQIRNLAQIPSFSDIKIEAAVLVALVHDWAKINIYESYMRNVKNEQTGVWEPTPAYRKIDSQIPFAHGMASLWTAQRFLRLNLEEGLAIAHHMGRWDAAPSTENELQAANKRYPLVHAIQFADQLAITEYQK
jgi:hypothetical protein